MNKNWPHTNAVDPAIYATRNDWPKISIVTPSYNQGHFIEETILSILNQNYPNLEYIIIDGGSDDDTLEVIKKYADRISYWVSEKDHGQSHAIKKGLARCTGGIFNWINSDDFLTRKALLRVAEHATTAPSLLCGNVESFSKSETFNIKNRNICLKNFLTNRDFSYHQPGIWFCHLSFPVLIDSIDESLNYSFDHDMMVNILKQNVEIVYLNYQLMNFRLHDDSKTVSSNSAFHKEFYLLFERYLNDPDFATYNIDIKNSINYFKEEWDWKDNISTIISASGKNNYSKAASLLSLIISQPKVYLNRTTLGAVKQLWTKN